MPGAKSSTQLKNYEDDSRREEENHPPQGGSVSPVQLADTESAHVTPHGADEQPAWKTTGADSGAKRDGYFKERDYKS